MQAISRALVESRHAGAVAIVRPTGEVAAALGEIAMPVFPRSAIKPLQAIACVESGAADRFGFGGREIALASASHSGTQVHADLAQSMLERAGLSPQVARLRHPRADARGHGAGADQIANATLSSAS